MPRFINGMDIGKSICEAIGIDPHLVHTLTIRIPCNGLVEIEIESVASEQMASGLEKKLETIAQTYHLVKKED